MASKPSNKGEFRPTARTIIEALPALLHKAFSRKRFAAVQQRADLDPKDLPSTATKYGDGKRRFKPDSPSRLREGCRGLAFRMLCGQ
jgi:hypothetical protein